MTTADTTNPPTAVQPARARGLKRAPRSTKRVTFNDLQKLRPGESLADLAADGLRWRCVAGSSGGKSAIYAEVRYKDPATGKRKGKVLGRLGSEEELEAEAIDAGRTSLNLNEGLEPFRERARAIRRKVRAGHDPRSEAGPDGLTLRQARALHVQAMRNDKRSQRSMEDIEYFSDRFLSDWLDLPLRKLTRDMLEERHSLIGRRAYKPSKRDKARGGRVSANKTMRYLRALVNEARARDATLPGFPTKFPWYDEQPKDAAIPLEQLPTWFREVAAMRNELKRDYYLLGVLTGVRRDSLSSIRCADLDLAARTLHIPCPKGGPSRAYTVPLSDDAMAVVERRLRATNNWLFPRADSKSGHIEEPRPEPGDGFTVPFTIHGLRHTYISASQDAEGVNLYRAMQLASHKVPKSDAHGGYSRRNVEALRPHQQRITDYFKALGLTV